MERCHSVLSLPQDSRNTAKYNLVKIARSDGETNTVFDEDIFCMGDHDFKSRKRKTSLSKSVQELNFRQERFVTPSSGRTAKRKVTRVPSQDDLWKSIQTNYTFLMADDLIAECQETRKELYLPPPTLVSKTESDSTSPPHHMLSYEEFLEKFNLAHDNLHSLQTSVHSMDLGEMDIEKLFSQCQYLKEQASLLKLMNPDLRDEVNRRCNILSNKLEILEKIMFPKRTQESNDTIKSLTSQMKSIRKWLQEVEGRLRKLKVSDDCATEEMTDVFSQEKILQREIEGRGKELTSLIRQCESLGGATVAESKRLRRAAAHLERSWHNIWIRSLEKQCLTEQRLLRRHNEESNHQEASDIELDEGPLNKHRRLTLDRWTAVTSAANMDTMRMDRNKTSADIIKTGRLTKEIGVLCSDLVPVNDKCIMVGTTGIAALKAEYGDDFTNFEIIQDVGYSSESSTHLSSDDGISVGGDRYFNIRVYNYADKKAPSKSISTLKEELNSHADSKEPSSVASSVGSSSGAPSFDDSGLGASDLQATGDSSETQYEKTLCDHFDPCLHDDESDFLETVLEGCVDFCTSDGGKEDAVDFSGVDDLQYNLSGIESDDSADNFHKKRSFTTSSQLFYKMILVDSENEEEIDGNENNNGVSDKFSSSLNPTNIPNTGNNTLTEFASDLNENIVVLNEKCSPDSKSPSTDSEQETYKASLHVGPVDGHSRNSYQKPKCLISTPVQSEGRRDTRNFASPNLKRKRDSDSNDLISTWEGGGGLRVRSWLKRCSRTLDSNSKTRVRRCLFRSGSGYSSSEECTQNAVSGRLSEDISSCDASGEYTSSSADEGNAMSSSSSFFDDDLLHFKERLDSCSAEGSVETVVRGLKTPRRSEIGSGELLPPPLSSTPSSLRRRQRATGSLRCCDGPFSNHSCADFRWFVMKASSEGDLRTRTWQVPTAEDSFTNIPTDPQHKESFSFDFKQRLSSSLPNVLRHRSDSSTDDTKGSVLSNSDSKTCRRCSQHDDSFTSFVSHNQSSSSDFEKKKKRRSRRKSSSSNRSSRTVLTGSDKTRVRSRTLTSQCSSSRRNLSQRSDFFDGSENNFFSESDGLPVTVHKVSKEDLNPKNLKDELELALKDKGCHNSASLFSPAESDIVLTHLEEQSTVSDQVWDGYQDMPYLSEAYSEATVDEDAVRKLTEFGDDYGSAIGQPLRFLDAGGDAKIDVSKSPSKKSSKSHSHSTDSDSDLEDLHHVIEEAGKALQFARATLKRRQSGDFFSSVENPELLATCGTHLHCLQTICEHIAIDGKENNFSDADLKTLHYLIEEWKILKRSVEMYEEVDEDKIKQKYLKAQKHIDDLFSKMSELSSLSEIGSKDFRSWDDLQGSISRLHMVLSTLQDTREQLLSVNLQVHRFVTEYGSDPKYQDVCLKEDITELYQKWEDIYEMNGTQLTELEILNTNWKKYIDKFQDLNSKLTDHLSSLKHCDINCHTLEDEVICSLQKDLKELKADSALLRKHLKNSETWKSIQRDLYELEKRINAHSGSSPVSRSVDHPNSSAVEDDPDDHFEDAIQQIDAYESLQRKKKLAPHPLGKSAEKKSSKFWRIIRVAVPVQLTLVLLFCLACYLEPNCCDRLNNFNFSLTPHLKYLRGPPPV